jgi:hypothetical protein
MLVHLSVKRNRSCLYGEKEREFKRLLVVYLSFCLVLKDFFVPQGSTNFVFLNQSERKKILRV